MSIKQAVPTSRRTVEQSRRRPHAALNPKPEAKPDSLTSLCREIGPCVYFIRTDDGLVKIGHTTDLAARKRKFGSGWDRILAVVPGTRDDEAALHERFAGDRVRGREFYAPTARVLRHVNDIRTALGLAPIEA